MTTTKPAIPIEMLAEANLYMGQDGYLAVVNLAKVLANHDPEHCVLRDNPHVEQVQRITCLCGEIIRERVPVSGVVVTEHQVREAIKAGSLIPGWVHERMYQEHRIGSDSWAGTELRCSCGAEPRWPSAEVIAEFLKHRPYLIALHHAESIVRMVSASLADDQMSTAIQSLAPIE